MNIALYSDVPFGGASRTMEEALRLLEQKHTITTYPVSSLQTSLRFAKDLDSIFLQRFKQHELANIINRSACDVAIIYHDRHFQAPWILRYLTKPTLFFCHEPTRAFFETFLKVDPNLPLLNRIYENLIRQIKRQIEIINARSATLVISNSLYSTESLFRSYGVSAKPIYLGVDPKVYYPQSLKKTKQVLVIGNDEPQKALKFAIKVISLIAKKDRPKLVIASPRKKDNSGLGKFAKKKRVDLTIYSGLNRDELSRLYNQSTVTLAVAHLEPFGLSVVESLACTTPVVAVAEGGFRETVIDGRTGLLIERNSIKIAAAIVKLLHQPQLRKFLGTAGRRDVLERFTWQITTTKIENCLEEIYQLRLPQKAKVVKYLPR